MNGDEKYSGQYWLGQFDVLKKHIESGRGVHALARHYGVSPAVMSSALDALGLEVLPKRVYNEIMRLRRAQDQSV